MTTQACKDFQISYMQETRWVVWWNFKLTLELSLNLEKGPNGGWLFCDLIAAVEIKLIKLSWAGAGQPIEKWNQAERPGNIFLLVIQLISRPSLYCYHLSYNVMCNMLLLKSLSTRFGEKRTKIKKWDRKREIKSKTSSSTFNASKDHKMSFFYNKWRKWVQCFETWCRLLSTIVK